jgi:predicted nucleic acid-binding Zn ribbon protein
MEGQESERSTLHCPQKLKRPRMMMTTMMLIMAVVVVVMVVNSDILIKA